MKAQGLHHIAGALLEGAGHGGKGIRGKELAGLDQAFHIGNAAPQVLLRHVCPAGVFLQHLVGHAAAGLAGGLAGSLALAAAALLGALAKAAGLKSLDSFHDAFLRSDRFSCRGRRGLGSWQYDWIL